MKRAFLSAALITKNEEHFLGECLRSLKGVADDVVVVDTGSTDRTKEIATHFGARVFDFPWTGDFSAARNRALDLCASEWILYIDADERVRADSASTLRAELSVPSLAGYHVSLHPLKGHTPYWCLRLFRNDPSIRFTGIIHESTWPSLRKYCARLNSRIGYSRTVIDHEGYETNHQAKNARNLPLLLKSLEQDPDRVYSWCHLANIYRDTQQRELAEEAWRKALAIVRRKGPRSPEDILAYIGLIEIGIELGRDDTALFEEALSLFPFSVQLDWLRGRMSMRLGNFAEALTAFEKVVAKGQSGNIDHFAAYDPKLFGVFAYDAIATCHLRLGHYTESRSYFELAAKEQPDRLEYRVKQALCSHLQLRAAGLEHRGLDQFHTVIKKYPQTAEASLSGLRYP